MKNISKMIIATGFFAVSMISISSCSKTEPEAEKSQEDFIQAVRAEKLESSTLRKFIELNGNIRAEKSMNVYPVVAGKITGSPVHLGSTVKKGDVVAYVDPSVPGSRYSLNEVTAPIDGTVISIPLKEGTRVDTETSVAVIGDLSNLQIIAYIPERYVSYLKKDLQAAVVLEAYPDEIFTATISEVSPVLDEATRTKEVVFRFEKNDSRINAGMFASLKLYLKDYNNVISVPTSCIAEKNGEKYIYLAEEQNENEKSYTVKLLKIQTGEEINNRTIVSFIDKENLLSDAKVIIEGFETLQNGSLVNIAE